MGGQALSAHWHAVRVSALFFGRSALALALQVSARLCLCITAPLPCCFWAWAVVRALGVRLPAMWGVHACCFWLPFVECPRLYWLRLRSSFSVTFVPFARFLETPFDFMPPCASLVWDRWVNISGIIRSI